jgi:transcriptional regulator with XRE-family HTH domain
MIRLTVERKRRGWTQAQLGRLARVHPNTISLVESERFIPGAGQLERLGAALGVRPADAQRLLEQIVFEPLTKVAGAAAS